jgi:hypothetical protein
MIDPNSDLARMKETGIKQVYVISPYKHEEEGIMEARYFAALGACGEMIMEGFLVLSVIVHCHPIAHHFDLPRGHEYWEAYDNSFIMKWAEAGYVLRFRDWSKSKGVKKDIGVFTDARKPVFYSGHYDIP